MAIIFSQYLFAHLNVFNRFFMDYDGAVVKAVMTGFDRFFGGPVRFLEYFQNG